VGICGRHPSFCHVCGDCDSRVLFPGLPQISGLCVPGSRGAVPGVAVPPGNERCQRLWRRLPLRTQQLHFVGTQQLHLSPWDLVVLPWPRQAAALRGTGQVPGCPRKCTLEAQFQWNQCLLDTSPSSLVPSQSGNTRRFPHPIPSAPSMDNDSHPAHAFVTRSKAHISPLSSLR